MKRLLISIAILLALIPSIAEADGGPHRSDLLQSNPATCSLCHQTHVGNSASLLNAISQGEQCLSCHGSGSIGADTDVDNGRYSAPRSDWEESPLSANEHGLRGGGFSSAVMDPDSTGNLTAMPTTSSHSIDESPATAWGAGPKDATNNYGIEMTLTCTNCHNPHGNGNYRMLRPKPYEMPSPETSNGVYIPDTNKVYLYAVSQIATDEYGNPLELVDSANSIDLMFNGKTAGATAKWGSDNVTWVLDSFTETASEKIDQIQVRFHADQSLSGSDSITLQLFDGSSWHDLETFEVSNQIPTVLTTHIYATSQILDSALKINSAKIRFLGGGSGTGNTFTVYLDEVRMVGDTTGSGGLDDFDKYTIEYSDGYRDTSYVPQNMSAWCAQCHTRYYAGVGSSRIESGDAVYKHQHYTSSMPGGCLSCHVSHGTTATMGHYSSAVPYPDGSFQTTGGNTEESRLLSNSNRKVCLRCHGDVISD